MKLWFKWRSHAMMFFRFARKFFFQLVFHKESLSPLPWSCNLLIFLNSMCYKYLFEEVQTLQICTKKWNFSSSQSSPPLKLPFLFQWLYKYISYNFKNYSGFILLYFVILNFFSLMTFQESNRDVFHFFSLLNIVTFYIKNTISLFPINKVLGFCQFLSVINWDWLNKISVLNIHL